MIGTTAEWPAIAMTCQEEAAGSHHADFQVRPMLPEEVPAVAQMHFELLGQSDPRGRSLAAMGVGALEAIFYRPNLDNPFFFCDVARFEGRIVGFSVYSTRRDRVFRLSSGRRFLRMLWATMLLLMRRPAFLATMLSNVRYLSGEKLPKDAMADGWWIAAGVLPECRSSQWELAAGVKVADALFDQMESVLRAAGCASWYGVARLDPPINRFLKRRGARLVASDVAQGKTMNYYVRDLRSPAEPADRKP